MKDEKENIYGGPDGPMAVPVDHPLNTLLEHKLVWEEENDGSFSAAWRPGEDPFDLAVISMVETTWVCFEPYVPDIETGKCLAEVLAQAAREFFAKANSKK